ncbi:hypothetical protein ACIN8IBEIGE_100124 [Acinetobacter sp. 8I-beige]|nr:hypothetical protein ACIN8IBEIGE_100124 [Acinetobacter sp. 8I-beige]
MAPRRGLSYRYNFLKCILNTYNENKLAFLLNQFILFPLLYSDTFTQISANDKGAHINTHNVGFFYVLGKRK